MSHPKLLHALSSHILNKNTEIELSTLSNISNRPGKIANIKVVKNPVNPLKPVKEAADTAEGSDEEDGSSAGEWVTHDNFERFGMGASVLSADELVTCATADYSVQNVLLQMGITPLTFDGYAVRNVKLWGLVCRACFAFTRDTQRIFCPKCGNDTVVRVPIVVDQDGQPNVLNSGRQLRKKGTVFSVPKPQSGRGWKPCFAEDEFHMGSRDRERRHAERIYEKERQLRDPFNEDSAVSAVKSQCQKLICRGR